VRCDPTLWKPIILYILLLLVIDPHYSGEPREDHVLELCSHITPSQSWDHSSDSGFNYVIRTIATTSLFGSRHSFYDYFQLLYVLPSISHDSTDYAISISTSLFSTKL
jgi:hypothetical protein